MPRLRRGPTYTPAPRQMGDRRSFRQEEQSTSDAGLATSRADRLRPEPEQHECRLFGTQLGFDLL
jgi:hypothetical protein